MFLTAALTMFINGNSDSEEESLPSTSPSVYDSETESDREYNRQVRQIMARQQEDATPKQALDGDDGGGTSWMEDCVYTVDGIVTLLYKLSLAIERASVKRDKSQKYAQFADAVGHYTNWDAKHIRENKIIEWELDRALIDNVEDLDSVHADQVHDQQESRSQKDDADIKRYGKRPMVIGDDTIAGNDMPKSTSTSEHRVQYLIDRFTNATQVRRQFLEYERVHQSKIAAAEDAKTQVDEERYPEETPEPIIRASSETKTLTGPTRTVFSRTTISSVALPVQDEIFRALEREPDRANSDSMSAHNTITSFATSVTSKRLATLSVPKPPDEHYGRDGEAFYRPFCCPYCRRIVQMRDKQHWKLVSLFPSVF